jgi:hypothetical protein
MTVPLTSQNSQPAQSEVPPPQYDSDNLANGEENIFTLPIGNHVDSVLEGNIQSMCDLCQDIRTTMRQIEAGLRGLDGHQSSALNTQWPLLREVSQGYYYLLIDTYISNRSILKLWNRPKSLLSKLLQSSKVRIA